MEQLNEEEMKKKLAHEILNEEWVVMAPHYKRGALILISKKLDLVDVATAIAMDNATQIETWIENQLLAKPTLDEVQSFEKNKTRFDSIIIQPFVIARVLD